MARIQGISPQEASLFTRLAYWIVRRKVRKLTGEARLVEPVTITAHHPRLFRAVAQMEMGQEAATTVPAGLKNLGSVMAATLIGCPF
jgi:hypothetical protein